MVAVLILIPLDSITRARVECIILAFFAVDVPWLQYCKRIQIILCSCRAQHHSDTHTWSCGMQSIWHSFYAFESCAFRGMCRLDCGMANVCALDECILDNSMSLRYFASEPKCIPFDEKIRCAERAHKSGARSRIAIQMECDGVYCVLFGMEERHRECESSNAPSAVVDFFLLTDFYCARAFPLYSAANSNAINKNVEHE